MNNKEFYLNRNQCVEIPTRPAGKYLLKENYLSEFSTQSDKNKVLTNLGILEKFKELEIGFSGNLQHLTDDLAIKVEELQNLDNTQIGWIYEDGDQFLTFSSKENYELYLTNPTKYQNLVLQIIQNGGIYVGSIPPTNKNILWLDNTSNHYDDRSDLLISIQKAIDTLQKQMNILMGIRTQGAISGNISDGTRTKIIGEAYPKIPNEALESLNSQLEEGLITQEEYDEYISEETDGIKPEYPEGEEPTVSHVSIKMGTWSQLENNLKNFINGELIWCTDLKKLYIYNNGTLFATSTGSGSSTIGDNDMDEQTINTLFDTKIKNVESIGFIPIGSETAQYTVKVNNDGQLVCYDNSLDNRQILNTNNNYQSIEINNIKTAAKTGLLINSFYFGGEADEHSYLPCSHNFVELANVAKDENGNPIDINLNGYYLYYKGQLGWYKLSLFGKIKSGGTFLIRGKQCSVLNANTTKIKVTSYDMEWKINKSGKEELISFDSVGTGAQDFGVLYLAWGEESTGRIYDTNGNLTDSPVSLVSYDVDGNIVSCAQGYIDLVGLGKGCEQELREKTAYNLVKGTSDDVIFRRWYILDPVTQSNPKELSKHNNKKYMTCSYLNGANFDPDLGVEALTPKASYENKTMAEGRSMFMEEYPSALTCSFGIQATDNGSGATRCFNWISVGYYDEGIKWRIKDSNNWNIIYSINSKEDSTNQILDQFKEYYNRKRWETSYGQSVTTHKVILRGLTPGTYEYQVFRKDNETYTSELRYFTVISDTTANNGFVFAQTTDQQGANWEEYEVWNLSAQKMVNEIGKENTYPEFNFTINTGDICYNGSRSNEWIDYFKGYYPLRHKEEMLTIGNNDLAPISMIDIGTGAESPWKINADVMDYFYCVEIDKDNEQIFTGIPFEASDDSTERSKIYKIPSLYSFNYGSYHFISLISEIRTISNSTGENGGAKGMSTNTVTSVFGIKDTLRGTNTHAASIYDVVERWIIVDLLKWRKQIDPNFDSLVGENFVIPKADSQFDLNDYRFNKALKGNCGKCLVYTHEMPFNIISEKSYSYYGNNPVPRETAKAYLNRYHDFEFQRSFKVWGIRLLFGGHKHTAAMTLPVYDAPLNYNPCTDDDDALFKLADGETSFSNFASFQPFIQITASDFQGLVNGDKTKFPYLNLGENVSTVFNNSSVSVIVNGQTYNKGQIIEYNLEKPRARVEIVDKITTPSYVMCHATGFKNKSNSDLAATSDIPWERHYVKGSDANGEESTSVEQQYYPFFTIYEVKSDGNIVVKMWYIDRFYTGGKAGYWDLVNIYQYKDTVLENREYQLNNSTIKQFGGEDIIINTN